MSSKLKLRVVSQEAELLDALVDSVTVPGTEGELTILPYHISLFTKIDVGELIYRSGGQQSSIVVSNGFLNVAPDNNVVVLVDSALHSRDISVQKAEQAIKQAHETMRLSQDRKELLMAEASLRLALLEIKIARKTNQ
ncbi:MAG TPA: ATP synthase F1 subunit epsilon [Candidatus Woesebacteria bacterium]|nr:ATP synthase F1 subunit epsilon [Candidatus Woesebacteria bacterium]HNS64981.1 ATP synthase F1 subunit epsilon [Candidatus Woesebacteria bacterium]